jgi:hypothetical protein
MDTFVLFSGLLFFVGAPAVIFLIWFIVKVNRIAWLLDSINRRAGNMLTEAKTIAGGADPEARQSVERRRNRTMVD